MKKGEKKFGVKVFYWDCPLDTMAFFFLSRFSYFPFGLFLFLSIRLSFYIYGILLVVSLSYFVSLSLALSFFLSLLLSLSFISLLLYLYFFSLFLSHCLISFPLLYFTFFCIISLSFPISLGIFPYPLSPITFSPSLYFSLNWFSNF